MQKILRATVSFALAAVLSAASWAADTPIGALVVKGKADITANDSTFTLTDQEYAYFSNDRIETGAMSRAVVTTSDGLRVAFGQSSVARVVKEEGTYTIDLQTGSMAVDAKKGVEYTVTRNGQAVTGGEQYIAGGEPYLARVTGNDDVEFYMPAQLEQEGERRSLLWWLIGGGAAAGTIYYVTEDDEDSSS